MTSVSLCHIGAFKKPHSPISRDGSYQWKTGENEILQILESDPAPLEMITKVTDVFLVIKSRSNTVSIPTNLQ